MHIQGKKTISSKHVPIVKIPQQKACITLFAKVTGFFCSHATFIKINMTEGVVNLHTKAEYYSVHVYWSVTGAAHPAVRIP